MAKKTTQKVKKTKTTTVKKKTAAVKKTAVKKKPVPAAKKTQSAKSSSSISAASDPFDKNQIIEAFLLKTTPEESLSFLLKNLSAILDLELIQIFLKNPDSEKAKFIFLFSGETLYSEQDGIPSENVSWSVLARDPGCFDSTGIPFFRTDEGSSFDKIEDSKTRGFSLTYKSSSFEFCLAALTNHKCTAKAAKTAAEFLSYAVWPLFLIELNRQNSTAKNNFKNIKSENLDLKKDRDKIENELNKKSSDLTNLEKQIIETEASAEKLKEDYKITQQELLKKKDEIHLIQKDLSEQTSEKEILSNKLSEFIRTSEIIKLENSDIQNQFNQYRNESENIINQLKSDHETQLNQYKNESENIINQLKSDHETEFGHYKNESLAKNSRYEDEISNLKSGLEKKLSENNQNWEEKYNSLLEKKSGTENEFRELENSFKALSSELVENKNSVIQKEEMIAGLEIEIQKLTESSKNSIQEQAALKKDFDDEISALNELHNEEKEHLQKKQDELLNRLESGKEKISILESQINQLEHTISENTDNFENSLKEKENQLQAQKVESSELAENLKNQINHEKEDKQNQIKEFEQITRNKDSEIEGLRHTINESNTAIQKLESNIEIARQKIHELENEREDLREQKESQQRTIAEQEINADSLKDQINSLHKDIDNLKEQITLQKSKEQKLNSEISSRNENIRNLENSLNNAKNEKLTLNSDIARLNEGLAISKQEIEELTLEIHNRKKEISELQNHERKLIEELNHAVEREKGSTEKGRLLEKILQSLTSTPDLHELLETVKGYLAEILPVDRMTIFSLHNESNLIIESVIENDTSLKQLAGTVISLSETQFGQTLAAQKSSIFNKNNSSENTDLPGVLENQEFAKTLSCAVIPLAVTGKTIGILTIASGLNDNFNENNIQIYSSLSPLISRTLMYHLNNLELQKSRKDRISTEKIEKFIAHKFKNIVSRIQNIQEQESYEVIPDIFSSFPDNKKSENDFKVWIETISEIIKKRLSAKISVNLDSHALRSLKNNTGINYELLFWYIAEAGDNTILHSDANAVEISLNEDSNFVALIYSDNGEGLTRTAGSETPEKGTGLDAIKEIIELSGGTFHKSKRPDSYGLELKAVWKKSSSM